MNKIKTLIFKLGILIFSFLLIACGSEEEQSSNKSKASDVVSSEQQTEAKQEVAKTQTNDSPIIKAAKSGDADAESEIEEEDSWYGKVTNWFGGLFSDELQKPAKNGDAKTQTNDSVSTTIKAAENGDANAQFKLGDMYADGDGVSKDREKAFYWWEKAAEQKHTGAQFHLGLIYADGDGVSKDREKAFHWIEKAAENGDAKAQYRAGWMYFTLQDLEKAVYWFGKAAENGDARAQYDLGKLYRWGEGVPEDEEKMIYWWEKAAEQGHLMAIEKLKEINQQ